MDVNLRRARPEDRGTLLGLWERSVRATHHFLADGDVVALRPLVAEALANDALDWWVLASATQAPIGFLGFAHDTIEALFIDPDNFGKGGGTLLVAHAQSLARGGALAVDVNEQNEAALRFYRSLGFSVVGRSPTDAGGRPFPILHLKRGAPGAPKAV
jgi:putative acetyltransferase